LTSTDYNSEDFQSELFRLHSQLLTESLLVSFPPLSYMLKFSGYSCLIGGPIGLSIYNHIHSFGIKTITIEIREQKFQKNLDVASKITIFRKDIVYDWVFISSRNP
jgi:hypothetical protein